MKFFHRFFVLLLCAGLVISLSACNNQTEQKTETVTKKESSAYQVGICRLHTDRFSDSLIQSFQDTLDARLKTDNITYITKEAYGDMSNMANMCSELDAQNMNLIFLETQGETITLDTNALKTKTLSTPELQIMEQTEDILLQLIPDISQTAILYDSSDPSSVTRAENMKKNLEADGIAYQEYAATDQNSLMQHAIDISDRCDSLYIATSDLMLDHIKELQDTFIPAGIPAITDSEELCQLAMASVSISSQELGSILGKMAADYLLNGTEPDAARLNTDVFVKKCYNPTICEDFEIEVPEELEALSTEQPEGLLLQ